MQIVQIYEGTFDERLLLSMSNSICIKYSEQYRAGGGVEGDLYCP